MAGFGDWQVPDIMEGIPMPHTGMSLTVLRIVQHPRNGDIYMVLQFYDGPGMPFMRIVVRYDFWLMSPGFLMPPTF